MANTAPIRQWGQSRAEIALARYNQKLSTTWSDTLEARIVVPLGRKTYPVYRLSSNNHSNVIHFNVSSKDIKCVRELTDVNFRGNPFALRNVKLRVRGNRETCKINQFRSEPNFRFHFPSLLLVARWTKIEIEGASERSFRVRLVCIWTWTYENFRTIFSMCNE